jgi:hypothetical protein
MDERPRAVTVQLKKTDKVEKTVADLREKLASVAKIDASKLTLALVENCRFCDPTKEFLLTKTKTQSSIQFAFVERIGKYLSDETIRGILANESECEILASQYDFNDIPPAGFIGTVVVPVEQSVMRVLNSRNRTLPYHQIKNYPVFPNLVRFTLSFSLSLCVHSFLLIWRKRFEFRDGCKDANCLVWSFRRFSACCQ